MFNIFEIIAPIYEKIHFGAEKSFKKIESLIVFRPTDRVLDLGGGSGRIAKFLKDKVQSVVVVDAAENMIKYCRRHEGIYCVRTEAENLPFADDSFDKIIVVDAFHHFQDQVKVVQEIKRVLAKNGEVVIEEFNHKTIGGKLVSIFEKLPHMRSVFHSPSALADLFLKNGFEIQIIDEGKIYYLKATVSQ